MTEYKVEFTDRLRRRHRKKAVKSYLQGLAEIIINSDGSYQKLESEKKKISGEINIFIDRIKRTLEIFDFAEGLSRKDMEEIFTKTGAKHKTHRKGGRSLFGKGLSDTLFSPIMDVGSGEVHSIKGGCYSYAIFKKSDSGEEVVDIKPDGDSIIAVDGKIRKKIHIEKDDGTLVKFRLSSKQTFPRDDTIVADLSNFYMLRFINSNPQRTIRVSFFNDNQFIYNTLIRFHEPMDKKKVGQDINAEYKFKDYSPIKLSGALYKTEKRLRGHSPTTGLDKRENGLLVYDEYHNMMDLQLFGFDEDPNAQYYFGTLCLEGAYEIIRDYMDKEDEEILTDTRDGFDRRHIIYREIRKVVDKWLREIISKDQLEESKNSFLSKETLEKQKEAFKKLNEIYGKINSESELLLGDKNGENEGLSSPLEFSIKTAKLILGKKYKVCLNSDIDLIPPNSKISIQYPNQLAIIPKEIIIKKPKSGKICSEYIELIPLKLGKDIEVIATYSEEIKAVLHLEICEEEYYHPKKIIEFYPKRLIIPSGKKKSAMLYIDLTRTNEKRLVVTPDSASFYLEKNEYSLDRGINTLNNIAKIAISVKALKDGAIGKITAFLGKEEDSVSIEVRDINDEKNSLEIFNDWIYKPLDSKFQIWPNRATKKMEINSNHPINQVILGKTKEEAEINFETFPHCQLLIGDLILTEFLKYTFHEAQLNGNISPNVELERYIQEKKYEIGKEILDLFVKKDQVEKLKSWVVGWSNTYQEEVIEPDN